jgi:hypothetical protein
MTQSHPDHYGDQIHDHRHCYLADGLYERWLELQFPMELSIEPVAAELGLATTHG